MQPYHDCDEPSHTTLTSASASCCLSCLLNDVSTKNVATGPACDLLLECVGHPNLAPEQVSLLLCIGAELLPSMRTAVHVANCWRYVTLFVQITRGLDLASSQSKDAFVAAMCHEVLHSTDDTNANVTMYEACNDILSQHAALRYECARWNDGQLLQYPLWCNSVSDAEHEQLSFLATQIAESSNTLLPCSPRQCSGLLSLLRSESVPIRYNCMKLLSLAGDEELVAAHRAIAEHVAPLLIVEEVAPAAMDVLQRIVRITHFSLRLKQLCVDYMMDAVEKRVVEFVAVLSFLIQLQGDDGACLLRTSVLRQLLELSTCAPVLFQNEGFPLVESLLRSQSLSTINNSIDVESVTETFFKCCHTMSLSTSCMLANSLLRLRCDRKTKKRVAQMVASAQTMENQRWSCEALSRFVELCSSCSLGEDNPVLASGIAEDYLANFDKFQRDTHQAGAALLASLPLSNRQSILKENLVSKCLQFVQNNTTLMSPCCDVLCACFGVKSPETAFPLIAACPADNVIDQLRQSPSLLIATCDFCYTWLASGSKDFPEALASAVSEALVGLDGNLQYTTIAQAVVLAGEDNPEWPTWVECSAHTDLAPSQAASVIVEALLVLGDFASPTAASLLSGVLDLLGESCIQPILENRDNHRVVAELFVSCSQRDHEKLPQLCNIGVKSHAPLSARWIDGASLYVARYPSGRSVSNVLHAAVSAVHSQNAREDWSALAAFCAARVCNPLCCDVLSSLLEETSLNNEIALELAVDTAQLTALCLTSSGSHQFRLLGLLSEAGCPIYGLTNELANQILVKLLLSQGHELKHILRTTTALERCHVLQHICDPVFKLIINAAFATVEHTEFVVQMIAAVYQSQGWDQKPHPRLYALRLRCGDLKRPDLEEKVKWIS